MTNNIICPYWGCIHDTAAGAGSPSKSMHNAMWSTNHQQQQQHVVWLFVDWLCLGVLCLRSKSELAGWPLTSLAVFGCCVPAQQEWAALVDPSPHWLCLGVVCLRSKSELRWLAYVASGGAVAPLQLPHEWRDRFHDWVFWARGHVCGLLACLLNIIKRLKIILGSYFLIFNK